MSTRLSRFCDGVMEAGWLLAVITVPLFFNVYSSRVFEPDKLALLRSIALVVGVAWVIKIADEGGPRFDRLGGAVRSARDFLRFPLATPVLALILSLLISTALSVTPRISLFGSYQRLQGTYTTLSYLLLFGSVLGNLRRRAQLERLLSVLIIASLPVSLFGLLQRFRLDPLPWGGDTVSRVSSSMGNPIFLGAYLILVIPVTFGRVVESLRAIVHRAGDLPRLLIRATIYVFIASIQLIALWMTGSRGPWLGFLAGSFFFFVLLTSHWRLRRLTVGTVGLAAALGVFLVVLNIPNGPLESLRSRPGLGRLGHVFETEQETGLVRVLIWRGAAEMMGPHPALEFPDGHRDPFNAIRPLVGYGPEGMLVAYNPFYPPELGQVERRTATPDRSHNETWDSLVTTGGIGLVAYLTLFASVFYYGLKWLGLMQSPLQRNLFLGLYAGGGVAGAAALVLWRGVPFFGVGLPFGIILGLIIYLTLLALFIPAENPTRPGEWRAVVLIGLIAGVMAHFVEIHFGIAVASSRTLFWLFAGMLAVVGLDLLAKAEPEPEKRRKEDSRRKRSAAPSAAPAPATWAAWLAGGVPVGAILAVIGFDFVNNPYRLTSTGAVVWQALTTLPTAGGVTSLGIPILIGLTWVLGSLLLALENGPSPSGANAWVRDALAVLGVSLGVALVFWLWLAAGHAGLSAQAMSDEATLLLAIGRLNNLLARLYVYLFILALVLGWALPEANRLPRPGRRGLVGAWLAVPLGVAALVAAFATNLRVIQADIVFKTAESFGASNNWEVATRLYLQASSYAPNEDYYYLFVGKGFLEVANRLTDPAEQANLVQEAAERLLEAQRLNPLNPDHTANLGRLYRWWASVAPAEADRLSRAQTADDYYARALTLSPNSALLWNEWAAIKLAFLNDRPGALEKIEQSLALDPRFDRTYALLGDYHAAEARDAADESTRLDEYTQAAEAYKQAVDLLPDSLNSRLALGAVYSATGDLPQAIEWYAGAIQYAPPEANLVNVYRALADLYRRDGDLAQAAHYGQLALETAPDEMKPELQEWLQEIQGN